MKYGGQAEPHVKAKQSFHLSRSTISPRTSRITDGATGENVVSLFLFSCDALTRSRTLLPLCVQKACVFCCRSDHLALVDRVPEPRGRNLAPSI